MEDCDLFGCLYNEDGKCTYKDAVIQEPFYQACRDLYDNGDYE